jgi:hypothetical protein
MLAATRAQLAAADWQAAWAAGRELTGSAAVAEILGAVEQA